MNDVTLQSYNSTLCLNKKDLSADFHIILTFVLVLADSVASLKPLSSFVKRNSVGRKQNKEIRQRRNLENPQRKIPAC